MKPVLYSTTAFDYVAPLMPTFKGDGVLSDCLSCKINRQGKVEWTLEMKYPLDGLNFEKVNYRDVIVVDADASGSKQPFRIAKITKNWDGTATIYAEHIIYDLKRIVVAPYTAPNSNSAIKGIRDHAINRCSFSFSADPSVIKSFEVKTPVIAWDLLGGKQGSLMDIYGGEYDIDKYDIKLVDRVGTDKNAKVSYGINMTDFQQEQNIAKMVDGVVGYWEKDDDIVYTDAVGTIPSIDQSRVIVVNLSDKYESKPTVEQLTGTAQSYLTSNQLNKPAVNWKVSFVDLAKTKEYSHIKGLESVSFGDTVTVVFPKLGVNVAARVCRTTWDVLAERYTSIELGNYKEKLYDTLASQQKAIQNFSKR